MDLSDVRKIRVPKSKKHRVGRGQGSGWGTTSGRGHKGAGQRSGNRIRLRFEGGQMPLFRRLPKKGFSNARFKVSYYAVNVGSLEKAFDAGAEVTLESVKAVGLAPKKAQFLKILGFGDLTKSLTVKAHGASAGAREKIESAGGSVELLPTRTEYRPRGVKKGGASADAAPVEAAPTPEPEPTTPDEPEAPSTEEGETTT